MGLREAQRITLSLLFLCFRVLRLLGPILAQHGLQDASKTASRTSKTPPRPPKTLPRRLQDGQDRLQDASKTAKTLPRCLQDASNTAQDACKTPRISKMPPRRPETPSRPSKTPPRCAHGPLSRLHRANHYGLLPRQWPCIKGGLAVFRPRRTPSIRQTTLVNHGRAQDRV